MPSAKQLNLELKLSGRGVWRPGSGRPRGNAMRHVSRHEFPGRCPLIVTVRVLDGIPRLRCGRFVRALRQTLARACIRSGFRVVHYSIQHDHVHFLIEADGRWFTGWRVRPPGADEEPRTRDVATARTWLLTKGWRIHHRLIDPAEVPTS